MTTKAMERRAVQGGAKAAEYNEAYHEVQKRIQATVPFPEGRIYEQSILLLPGREA